MRALLSTESESGKFDKIVFVIKMTTENEHTASSQISEDETQKVHKKKLTLSAWCFSKVTV